MLISMIGGLLAYSTTYYTCTDGVHDLVTLSVLADCSGAAKHYNDLVAGDVLVVQSGNTVTFTGYNEARNITIKNYGIISTNSFSLAAGTLQVYDNSQFNATGAVSVNILELEASSATKAAITLSAGNFTATTAIRSSAGGKGGTVTVSAASKILTGNINPATQVSHQYVFNGDVEVTDGGKLFVGNAGNIVINGSMNNKAYASIDIKIDNLGELLVQGTSATAPGYKRIYNDGDRAATWHVNAGGTLRVIYADLDIKGYNTATFSGNVFIKWGDFNQHGGAVIFANGSKLYVSDLNKGTGHGLITFYSGAGTLTNNGLMYIDAFDAALTGGSGVLVNNATVYLKNASVYNSNAINNLSSPPGADLHFCGVALTGTGGSVTNNGVVYNETGAKPAGWLGTGTYTATGQDQATCEAAFYAAIAAPLPVTWSTVACQRQGKFAAIEWSVLSEPRNEYYEVQKSIDGENFIAIGMIRGMSDSLQAHSYLFIDQFPPIGTTYYRIRQVDIDGKYSFSTIAVLSDKSVMGSGTASISAAPGSAIPVSSQATAVEIADMRGALIVAARKGSQEIMVSAPQKIGMYYMIVHTPKGTSSSYLIVK